MINLIDKHFRALPIKKKAFLAMISTGFLLIAIIGYQTGYVNLVESFLIFVIGSIYMELMKFQYRVTNLENEKKKRGNKK